MTRSSHVLRIALVLLLALLADAAQALTPEQRTEMLAAHNRLRKANGVPPLKWSPTLAASAQRWADALKDDHSCRMKHSDAAGHGENLYGASARLWSDGRVELQNVPPSVVVGAWANEKKHYDYARNRCAFGRQCEHYTQIVWKSTTEAGCARAVCADQSQVWVCQYTPAGNLRGHKPY